MDKEKAKKVDNAIQKLVEEPDKELEEKCWKDRKIEKIWITEGFGKANLEIATVGGRLYQCDLKKLNIRLARLKAGGTKICKKQK